MTLLLFLGSTARQVDNLRGDVVTIDLDFFIKNNLIDIKIDIKKKNLTCGGQDRPHGIVLRGRMTFSQQAKKTPEPLPHPYTGARRFVS